MKKAIVADIRNEFEWLPIYEDLGSPVHEAWLREDRKRKTKTETSLGGLRTTDRHAQMLAPPHT